MQSMNTDQQAYYSNSAVTHPTGGYYLTNSIEQRKFLLLFLYKICHTLFLLHGYSFYRDKSKCI